MSKQKSKEILSHYERYKDKFGYPYYNEKYKQLNCKLKEEDYNRLKKILEKNKIGFTEFVCDCIELLEKNKLVTEKRLE